MKIVKLQMENFKRIEAVEITPDGNTVLITGKNGMGKSSILDAIVAVLCGKKHIPDKPIRDGEDHAEISITTENWIIKRTFTDGGGGSVTIKNKDGMTGSKPQQLLDKIRGSIAFDPMKFIAMGDTEAGKKEQRTMLMELAGLDFADIDAEIANKKTHRGFVRKDKERLEGDAERITVADDTPNEEVSVVELAAKLVEANEYNATQADVRHRHAGLLGNKRAHDEDVLKAIEEVKRIEELLGHARAKLASDENKSMARFNEAAALLDKINDDKDTELVQQEIAKSETVNGQVRQKKQKADLAKQAEAKAEEWRKLGKDMKDLEQKKATRLSEAKMPLEGLSVTDDCVVMGKIPLSQVNGAEQLRVGLGIAMAQNPELRVILMNGNDLDSDSLKVISEMTADQDYQVWIERIEGEGGIVIEDGMVKTDPTVGEMMAAESPSEFKKAVKEGCVQTEEMRADALHDAQENPYDDGSYDPADDPNNE